MSQRLHIGKSDREPFYDCIVENGHQEVREKLLSEWFCLNEGFFIGPWKITIGDVELFKKIEPILSGAFELLGKKYPDDVWQFYQNNRSIEHPTTEELAKWIEEAL